MVNKYSYTETSRIQELATKINTYKDLFEKIPKLPKIQENLLRRSTLKSALYSARIEGNTLEFSQIERGFSKQLEKKEVFQIFNGLKFVYGHKTKVTKEFICQIHEIVMDGLTTELGRLRSEQSAIFNSAGVAIYVAPSPEKMPELIQEFINYINRLDTELPDVAIAHFAFEKAHPFLDGNGRVGRILINWHLKRLGYGFAGLISFEEYLENSRTKYYSKLSTEGNNITGFVELILETIAESAQKVILELEMHTEEKIEDTLLPRRAEILAIIREHQMVSFDQIMRRFFSVNPRTLHYDLQDLIKKNLIRRLGATRGAVYTPR